MKLIEAGIDAVYTLDGELITEGLVLNVEGKSVKPCPVNGECILFVDDSEGSCKPLKEIEPMDYISLLLQIKIYIVIATLNYFNVSLYYFVFKSVNVSRFYKNNQFKDIIKNKYLIIKISLKK